jgi:hypothetical protein
MRSLKSADLANGEINKVPMSAMDGLESRGLVSSAWRGPTATSRGSFPEFGNIRLTAVGLRAARNIQGLRADL